MSTGSGFHTATVLSERSTSDAAFAAPEHLTERLRGLNIPPDQSQ
jgi:hypothetical protein